MAKFDDDIIGSGINIGGDVIGYNKVGGNIAGRDIIIQHVNPDTDESNNLQEDIQHALEKLAEQIEAYFDIIAETLHHNPKLQEEYLKRLQSAKEVLRKNEEDDHASTLSIVQFEVRRVHVGIAREQQSLSEENRLRWAVPALVLIYIAIVVAVIFFGTPAQSNNQEIPILGVPISVMIWAAVGSIAAILYRFYTREPTRITSEIRWLIARPIIGVIMGAVGYLAIVSGLLIFGTAVGADENFDSARPQLLWLLAFLGGFSDRFFEVIIDAVVSRFSSDDASS
ncbi:MAG: hypothetical protein AAF485_02010 [Chloroflexota bacterium]